MALTLGVQPETIRVRHARLQGTGDGLRAQPWLESALADLSPIPAGRTSREVLIVRRLAPTVPLRPARKAESNRFIQVVAAGLERCRREAGRPWLDHPSNQARAVLFTDEAELAACGVRDGLRGSLAEHWWRHPVLEDLTLREWWRRHLLPRGDLLPPVLSLLAGQGWVIPWVTRLSDRELEGAAQAVATAHDLTSSTAREDLSQSPDDGSVVAELRTPGPRSLGIAYVQLEALVPEVRQVTGSRAGARFLALGLALQRDPVWTRGAALRLALPVLDSEAPTSVDETAKAAGPVATDPFAKACREGRPLIENDTAEPRGPPVDSVPPRHVATTASATHPTSDPTKGEPHMPSAVTLPGYPPGPVLSRAADAPGPIPAVPDRMAKAVRVITDVEPRPGAAPKSAAVRPDLAGVPTSRQSSAETDDRAGHPRPASAVPRLDAEGPEQMAAGTSEVRDGEADDGLIQREPASSAKQSPLAADLDWPAPMATSIETPHGGLFYLLNLALALGLYGDFTQPRRPGIGLSPWDWLALVGRAWLGRTLQRDPLWGLLARLAGRSPGQTPGGGFASATLWTVPEEWLVPWGAAGPISVQTRRGRLQLQHLAGFLLADVPREPGTGVVEQAGHLCAGWPVLGQARLVRVPLQPRRKRSRPTQRPSAFGPRGTNLPAQRTLRPGMEAPVGRLPADRALARWLTWLLPYLEARLALALGAEDPTAAPNLVCRHRARIEISATALDVHLSLAELPITLRIAGLDRDPGWIPAAGRSVAFHFL